ncbi:MAG TPA: hypothetical protein G4O12_01240 [Dehalococcoidia bacterium]|nr:hypothetical protein [Dehalococcoidia bacterium]
MGKRVVYIFLLPLILLSMAIGCVSSESIKQEVVDCFVQMIDETVDWVEADLDSIEKHLSATKESVLKLEQVVTPALTWAEEQKADIQEVKLSGSSWSVQVDREWLSDTLNNDQYQVTSVKLSVFNIGTPEQKDSLVIEVADLTAEVKRLRDWELIDSELKTRLSRLSEQRQALIDSGETSTATLRSVIEHVQEWEIRRINDMTYSVSGAGLGMSEELTSGKWTYYRDSKEIVPADAQSVALWNILSGK